MTRRSPREEALGHLGVHLGEPGTVLSGETPILLARAHYHYGLAFPVIAVTDGRYRALGQQDVRPNSPVGLRLGRLPGLYLLCVVAERVSEAYDAGGLG
jgi:hypothetical protein